ncbi:7843_t:CDS:1, partial [Scutellospora calospora]
ENRNLLAKLDEKLQETSFLDIQIQELTNLIKKLKEKIVNAYIYFAPEKELLQKLIIAHLEFTKAKKQGVDSIIKYRKQFNKLYEEIEIRLNSKLIQDVEIILNDCEEVVTHELELETKLNSKLLIFEEQKRSSQITNNTCNNALTILSQAKDNKVTEQLIKKLEKELAKEKIKNEQLVQGQNQIEKKLDFTNKFIRVALEKDEYQYYKNCCENNSYDI